IATVELATVDLATVDLAALELAGAVMVSAIRAIITPRPTRTAAKIRMLRINCHSSPLHRSGDQTTTRRSRGKSGAQGSAILAKRMSEGLRRMPQRPPRPVAWKSGLFDHFIGTGEQR